jgi:hypothetical protein
VTGFVRIGLDFDNTLVCYNSVFRSAAQKRGLVDLSWAGSKVDLRNLLRGQEGGELAWQKLQSWVYGAGIFEAELYPGVIEFLRLSKKRNADVFVVSHKTQFGHDERDRVDLRQSARQWMDQVGLVGSEDFSLNSDCVYFESTLADKVQRIVTLDLDFFVDDLPEVFMHRQFPADIKAILFATPPAQFEKPVKAATTWDQIAREIFA